MSDPRAAFLHRLFERGPDLPWTTRWPEAAFPPWDGGASELGSEEDLRKIAATCGASELRKILRHGNEQVLLLALENPAISPQDILHLSGSPKASANVLAAIARNKEWSGDPQVAKALCLNTKTPYYASRFLLGPLSSSDLREIAQSTLVPPTLAGDALAMIDKKRTRKFNR